MPVLMERFLIVALCVVAGLWLASRVVKTMRPCPHSGDVVRYLRSIDFQDFDLIFFHSNVFISLSTGCWSHVGIIVRRTADGVPLLFDITGSHGIDLQAAHKVLTKELFKSDRVIAMRRISPAPDAKMLHQLRAYVVAQTDTRYTHKYWRTLFRRLFGWAFPLPRTNAPTESICSELIADVLAHCGLLHTSVHVQDVFPDDMAKGLPLAPGYSWGPLTFIRLLRSKPFYLDPSKPSDKIRENHVIAAGGNDDKLVSGGVHKAADQVSAAATNPKEGGGGHTDTGAGHTATCTADTGAGYTAGAGHTAGTNTGAADTGAEASLIKKTRDPQSSGGVE